MARQLPAHKLKRMRFVPYLPTTARALQPAIDRGEYVPWKADASGVCWFERDDTSIEADQKRKRQRAEAAYQRLVLLRADGQTIDEDLLAWVLRRADKLRCEFEHDVSGTKTLFEEYGGDEWIA